MSDRYVEVPYVAGITSSSFDRFWPFYLGQHSNITNRRLHIIGTSVSIAFVITALSTANFKFFLVGPLLGYATAWVGHLVFEKNRPATFQHPMYSLMGDLRLWKEVITGQRPF